MSPEELLIDLGFKKISKICFMHKIDPISGLIILSHVGAHIEQCDPSKFELRFFDDNDVVTLTIGSLEHIYSYTLLTLKHLFALEKVLNARINH
jgi:hypothetical protein